MSTPFEMGQAAADRLPPLTDEQIDRLVLILQPYTPAQRDEEAA